MPPFVLLSLVGPAVALHNNATLLRAFPDRYYVSPNLEKLVAAGKPAIYGADEAVDPEVASMFETGDVRLTSDQVRERASRRWPKRPASCSTRVSWSAPRTSTWA